MATDLLSTQISGFQNQAYENIINQLQNRHFACVDDFFDTHILENLHQRILYLNHTEELKKAAIGKYFDQHIKTEIRGDYIQWIDDKTPNIFEQSFFVQIQDFIDYLNKTCFLGIFNKEFHYAVYPQGRFYKRHLDTFQNDKRRKLSIILYLNKNWSAHNGGELVVYLKSENKEKPLKILPKFGRFIIFESQVLEHEVKPVKQNLRLSITGWLKTI